MKYVRLYADAAGESHFEDQEVAFSSADYTPPAPPLEVSAFAPAAAYGFLRVPTGYYGDWHPAPRRQLLVYLAGHLEAQASDKEVRQVGPGTIALVEDTTGKGHISRVLGAEDVLNAVVQLPD